jgi:hypothetical protein
MCKITPLDSVNDDARELEEEHENNSVELINDIGGINEYHDDGIIELENDPPPPPPSNNLVLPNLYRLLKIPFPQFHAVVLVHFDSTSSPFQSQNSSFT